MKEKAKKVPEQKPTCECIELYNQYCLRCNQKVPDYILRGTTEDQVYREYALLGRGRGHLIRADHAAKFLKREIDTLFANRRLVLVLDLDCTLIHASEPQKDFRMFHRKPGFELVCKTRGIY